MQDGVKSSLLLTKKDSEKQPSETQVQFKEVESPNDYLGELSDEEKEKEFNKQHEEYIQMKIARKQELIRRKMEEFGPSSSDNDSDASSDQEEIKEVRAIKRVESKRSKGKIEPKAELPQKNSYSVVLELKKTLIETELLFADHHFEINKRNLSYTRVNRVAIAKSTINGRQGHKVRISIGSDEDIVLSLNDKFQKGTKALDLFMRLVRVRVDVKSLKAEKGRCNPEQFGELREGALICDKIFKKSQVFGKWEERYVVIRGEGLLSFRSMKEKPSMEIPVVQIVELVTQFEWFKETLVVKLVYNGTKTDFGVPLGAGLEWVLRFGGLLQ